MLKIGVQKRAVESSPAFRDAALRSETRRAFAVVGVIMLVAIFVLPREATRSIDRRLLISGFIGIGVLFVIQLMTLAMVRRAKRTSGWIPEWFTLATVVIESLIPTGMISSHIVSNALPPYAALSTPPAMAYAMMLSLTTLRLRPWLCVLAGVISAAGYGGLVAYAIFVLKQKEPSTGLPLAVYFNNAVMILISGVAAAWVSREIRGHMEAALGEAETKQRVARMEQDLEVARTIQQALLPRGAPSIPGFEVAGWNLPADQTGGDYYDWQAMPDGNWIVTLADVSGHGVGPAMVTAACRAYMRAISSHHRDLTSLTSRMNQLLAEDLPEGRFVTMVSVLIGRGGGPVGLLSAGHGPIVLLIGSTGEVKDIVPDDLPLAIVPDTAYGPGQQVELAPGDVLALVTDGFVEWARHDASGKREEFGMGRLRDSLRMHAHLPAAEMIKAITGDVRTFAGDERQQDDLTMVLIRRATS